MRSFRPQARPCIRQKRTSLCLVLGAPMNFITSRGGKACCVAALESFYVSSADTALQATNFYPHQRPDCSFWRRLDHRAYSSHSGGNGQPPYTNQNILGYYPGFANPRTFEWNVAIQQALGSSQNLTVGYVGSAGRDLTRQSQFYGGNYGDRFLTSPSTGTRTAPTITRCRFRLFAGCARV